jgi:hypothetical protein
MEQAVKAKLYPLVLAVFIFGEREMENKESVSIEQQVAWRRLWDILLLPMPSQLSTHEAASESSLMQVHQASDPDKVEVCSEREN